MGELKPGTPVKNKLPLHFGGALGSTARKGVEGFVVEVTVADSTATAYKILFPGEAMTRTLMYPDEIEVDVDRLPEETVEVRATEVRLLMTVIDGAGNHFVVGCLDVPVDLYGELADEVSIGGRRDDGMRTEVTVSPYSTGMVTVVRKGRV